MKNFLNILLLISVFLLLTTCKKNNTPSTSLPPATQTGDNTFGCKVNGEVWVPYYPCVSFGNPCQEMQVSVINYVDSDGYKLNVGIGVGRKEGEKESFFNIGFPANKVGNIYDSARIEYLNDNSLIPFGVIHYKPGVFEITKLDTINKIISGVFNLNLYNGSGDSIIVTDGRFDFQLQPLCKCSQ